MKVFQLDTLSAGRVHGTGGLCLVMGMLLSLGCDLPGKPDPNDEPLLPTKVMDFASLFGQHCAGCHGATGKLGAAPPLNDPLFVAIVPEGVLHSVITHGRSGTLMPAFGQEAGGPLTSQQVRVLVEGIRTDWGGSEKPDGSLPEYAVRKESAGDAKAGAEVFMEVCAKCHGPEGRGGDKAGAVNDQAFLALISDQALRRIVITGRPDLGMPDYRTQSTKPLTPAQVTDVAALLASWRQANSSDRPASAPNLIGD